VDGKPHTQLICRDRNALNDMAFSCDYDIFWNYRDRYFMLARENFPEPANTPRHREHRAEGAD
jgi:hypothetical protein